MAEKFLEEIYADALVLDDLRECLSFMARTDYYNARLFFNKGMARLEIMLAKYAIENPDSANEIQDFALDIIDKWGEWSYISGMIRGKLIPMIYEYMKRFCTIDVEEGNFLLKSSDSGFLTMKDIEENMFIHDIHDPMLEAGDVADMLYHPLIEDYVLYGCGLGYLPYKLWTKQVVLLTLLYMRTIKEFLNMQSTMEFWIGLTKRTLKLEMHQIIWT